MMMKLSTINAETQAGNNARNNEPKGFIEKMAVSSAPSPPTSAKHRNLSSSSNASTSSSSSSSNSTSSITNRPRTNCSNSNSSSMDDIEQSCGHQQPNELIIDQNQAIAIELPPNTLKIDLSPFKPASEVHPEPGDIIEFDRTLFSQWAIFVGDGDVVAIVGNHSLTVPDTEIALVQRSPLILVAGDNYCRVNNKLHRAKERNLLPFHNEIVVRKALSKVGSTVPFNALQCNTEHYVTEWKYGQRWSDQAQVSLHSFKALRLQHTNSITESHNVFVNTLNEVLNSPAIVHSTTAGSMASPTGSSFSCPCSTPIPFQQNRHDRSISVGSSPAANSSPPNMKSVNHQSSMPCFNTAECQTEMTFF